MLAWRNRTGGIAGRLLWRDIYCHYFAYRSIVLLQFRKKTNHAFKITSCEFFIVRGLGFD